MFSKAITLSSTILAVMLVANVQASDHDDDKQYGQKKETMAREEPKMDTNRQGFVSKAPSGAVSAEALIGTEVVTKRNQEEVGEVEDILMSRSGKPLAVIIEVGGMWEMGDDHVAVAWDRLSVSADPDRDSDGEEPDDYLLVADVNEEVIEEAPGFEYDWD